MAAEALDALEFFHAASARFGKTFYRLA